MPSAVDVARLITEQMGEISAMKLQKLVYYSQAWSLVWEEQPLIEEDFEAWANGPVIRALYERHRGRFSVDANLFADGNPDAFSNTQRENVLRVLEFYGKQTAQWLSDLTHNETPWLAARGDTAIGAPSNAAISKAAMHEYYSSL
ncbi:Panacea domain-containing protein [Allorhizobium terrae]|uniref:DUF4065 domain-containing protein n=1 Tax=Allorhizobium terrae TaxID=1848972 RepID=A0A4S3ZTH0_9HYPH|nr:type II toxin-antitoxin system antitoxin SocA domain-containing protein [Allorhizobium terrae]THF48908.1 DUF4065 domain-containing protein [Allorhizobium terrae]